MVRKYLDDCYVIGTSLLYLDKFSNERAEQIKNNLMESGIDTMLTDESISATVSEWKDFFEITKDHDVVLTKGAKQNQGLVFMIFHGVLPGETREILMSSIFNYSHQKVIQFKRN